MKNNIDISINEQKLIKDRIDIGLQAFELFINEEEFFNFPNDIQDKSLLGNLRTYSIEKSFYDFLTEDDKVSYSINFKKINNFGKNAMILNFGEYFLTVSKIPESIFNNKYSNNFYLDSKANYKKELALLNNDVLPKQINMFEKRINENRNVYGQILYRYNNKDLSVLKIIIPDSSLCYSLKQIDVLKEIKNIKIDLIEKESKEEQIIFLKKGLEKYYKRCEING